jgi:predicted flap endonuclease-1-like 5' DNA nuclease/predicted  nucleic acid-binding Zn-ribbon protein
VIYLIIKVVLWLALAFALGSWLGWWLRRFKANAAQAEHETKLLVLTDSKNSLAAELDGKRQTLLAAETTLGNKEQDLLNQTNEVLRVQRLYSQSGIRVAELEDETTQLSGELVLQQDQLTKLESRKSELAAEHEASVADLLVERSTLQDKLATTDQDLAAATSRLGAFTSTQKDLEERLAGAESESAQGVGKLQAKVAGLEQQRSKLQQQHQEQVTHTQGLDKSNNQLETKVASLLAELEQAQNNNARGEEQLTLQLANLTSDLGAATELATQRQRELDANNEAVSNNDDQVRRLTEDVRRWRSRIPDLQSELDEKEAQVRERDSRLATIEEQLSGRSQRLQLSQQALIATKTNSTGPQQAQARIAQLLAQLDKRAAADHKVAPVAPLSDVTLADVSPVATSASTQANDGRSARRPASFYRTRPSAVDDLQRIKGIGPKLEGLLQGLGIYQFVQISKLTPTDVAWLDDHLNFKGRIERDEWIRQAQQFC